MQIQTPQLGTIKELENKLETAQSNQGTTEKEIAQVLEPLQNIAKPIIEGVLQKIRSYNFETVDNRHNYKISRSQILANSNITIWTFNIDAIPVIMNFKINFKDQEVTLDLVSGNLKYKHEEGKVFLGNNCISHKKKDFVEFAKKGADLFVQLLSYYQNNKSKVDAYDSIQSELIDTNHPVNLFIKTLT